MLVYLGKTHDAIHSFIHFYQKLLYIFIITICENLHYHQKNIHSSLTRKNTMSSHITYTSNIIFAHHHYVKHLMHALKRKIQTYAYLSYLCCLSWTTLHELKKANIYNLQNDVEYITIYNAGDGRWHAAGDNTCTSHNNKIFNLSLITGYTTPTNDLGNDGGRGDISSILATLPVIYTPNPR